MTLKSQSAPIFLVFHVSTIVKVRHWLVITDHLGKGLLLA